MIRMAKISVDAILAIAANFISSTAWKIHWGETVAVKNIIPPRNTRSFSSAG
jgi:hypothetical protein